MTPTLIARIQTGRIPGAAPGYRRSGRAGRHRADADHDTTTGWGRPLGRRRGHRREPHPSAEMSCCPRGSPCTPGLPLRPGQPPASSISDARDRDARRAHGREPVGRPPDRVRTCSRLRARGRPRGTPAHRRRACRRRRFDRAPLAALHPSGPLLLRTTGRRTWSRPCAACARPWGSRFSIPALASASACRPRPSSPTWRRPASSASSATTATTRQRPVGCRAHGPRVGPGYVRPSDHHGTASQPHENTTDPQVIAEVIAQGAIRWSSRASSTSRSSRRLRDTDGHQDPIGTVPVSWGSPPDSSPSPAAPRRHPGNLRLFGVILTFAILGGRSCASSMTSMEALQLSGGVLFLPGRHGAPQARIRPLLTRGTRRTSRSSCWDAASAAPGSIARHGGRRTGRHERGLADRCHRLHGRPNISYVADHALLGPMPPGAYLRRHMPLDKEPGLLAAIATQLIMEGIFPVHCDAVVSDLGCSSAQRS